MSSSAAASLWESFRANPASEGLYLEEAHIVFLPTGAGAASEKHIRDFYQSGGFSHPKKLSVEEKTIHRTVGESSAVDEVEVTVKFVSGAGGWLLPGIEPHHLEDLAITFPLVICASFAEDRIASVRYVWDNASVLKMVKLIGSRQSWPIVAEAQVDALREPSRFRLNPYGNATAAAGSRPQTGISKIFSSPPVSPPQRTTAGIAAIVQKKGHPALTSTVFSHLKSSTNGDSEPLSPSTSDEYLGSRSGASSPPLSSTSRKGHPALTSTLFNNLKYNDVNDQQEDNFSSKRERAFSTGNDDHVSTASSIQTTPVITKKGHPALTSTVFSHLKDDSSVQPPKTASNRSSRPDQQQQQEEQQQQLRQEEVERGAGWRADYVKPKGHPALTSTIFSSSAQTSIRPTARQQQQEQEQQNPEERGAGWRADYVKPKGHPALTSTIFSQHAAPTPSAGSSRPYKKTSHNIFGTPAEESSNKSKSVQATQQEQEPKEYTLEPSAIEAELERNEQQQCELRHDEEEDAEAEKNAAELADLERQIQEQEKLNALAEQEDETRQQELEKEKENLEKVAKIDTTASKAAGAPLSPLSPPPSATRRVHPNYKSSFTIGGPR